MDVEKKFNGCEACGEQRPPESEDCDTWTCLCSDESDEQEGADDGR